MKAHRMFLIRVTVLLVAFLVFVFVLLVSAARSDATRPVPGYPYTDRCVNVPGTQPAYLLVGSGPYRPVPGRPGSCYSWRRVR